jgi:hypothetical protein
MKARITVHVTHEAEGGRQPDQFDMLLPAGDHKASTAEVFKQEVKERLEQELKLVNVEFVRYELHPHLLIKL